MNRTLTRRRRRTGWLLSTTVALALLAAGCGDSDDGDAEPVAGGSDEAQIPEEMVDVSFQTFPLILAGVPVKVATEQGFFEDNNLNVSSSDGQSGPAMVAALVAGQVDFVGVPSLVAIQSNQAGAEIQAVSGLAGGGGSLIFVGNDVPETDADYPESARVLDDATFAVAAPGGLSDRLFRYIVEDADVSGAEFVTLPGIAENIAALKEGRIDVANLDLVSAFRAEQDGAGRILYDFQETGPDQFRGVATNPAWATASFVEEQPEVAFAFAKSIAQAVAWLNDPANEEEAKAYFAEIAGTDVPDDVFAQLLNAMKPSVGVSDIEAYVTLLDDAGDFDPETALSQAVPRDEDAAEELAGS